MRAGHRCRHGWPQVLVMHPLRSSGKIGDLMRLTCPLLVSAIDEYNKGVKHDDDWLSQLLATHEAHRSLRQASCPSMRTNFSKREGSWETRRSMSSCLQVWLT